MTGIPPKTVGEPVDRVDGVAKVTGTATYSYEYPIENVAYLALVQSTVAAGRVIAVNADAALALPETLAVLWHGNAPRLALPVPEPGTQDVEGEALQSPQVMYHGQVVAAVAASSLEAAHAAAALVTVQYERQPHDVVLDPDGDGLYRPALINAGHVADTAAGDVEAGLAAATVTTDHWYRTPAEHNNPMEPHSTIALWDDDGLTLYDANQGPQRIKSHIAAAFGLPPERVRVISTYVGGGFGAKVLPHPHLVLTVMGAQATGRPVKLALTRQQMFSIAGYRTPTIQRVRLGADAQARLTAIAHDVVEQSSMAHEFAEQTALASRFMYAAPNRATTHRLARLHVPHPSFMRAPGETPGMFALETAIDELAIVAGIDPVDLRLRNLPSADLDTGKPFSSHGLGECLLRGAERFGWRARDPRPRARRSGRHWVGTGVAAATYPARQAPASALIRAGEDGHFSVLIGACDIGTGAWTILTQIAADALGVPLGRVRLRLGDTELPAAGGAGGSMGTASWGSAIVLAAERLTGQIAAHGGAVPAGGLEASARTTGNPAARDYSTHAFGAQFAEVRVDADTGEVSVPRLTGVFAVGNVMNPKTARSQLVGGMTMGLSMALLEESVLDPRTGDFVNRDFAGYHIATNADVGEIDVSWIEEKDVHLNPMGAKGVGEIGIVGTAAAIGNAVYHATGVRVRELPVQLDKLLG